MKESRQISICKYGQIKQKQQPFTVVAFFKARDVSVNLAATGLPAKMQRMTGAGFRLVKTRAELKPVFTSGGRGGIIKT